MAKKGVWYLVLAAVLCSIGGVCIKAIPWAPMAINGGRNAIAALVTGIYLHKRHVPVRLTLGVVCGGLSLALTTNLYVLATKLTGAACAVLLMHTAPLWMMLYFWFVRRHRPAKNETWACVLVFLGLCLFTADGFTGGTVPGLLCGIGSGIAYAGVFLVNSWPGGDAVSAYFFGQVFSAIIGMPFLVQERNFSFTAIGCLVLLGVFQLGLSYIFMAKGLAATPPVTAGLITALEPILTPVWVLLFLGEVPTTLALLGCSLVLASVIYSAVSQKQTE